MGDTLGLWTTLPFVGLLFSIALLPLAAPHFWHQNRNQALVAAVFGVPIGLYMAAKDYHLVLHTGAEYFSFIILLAALYIVSGGIYITGNLIGTPRTNCLILGIGAVLANLVGTTGASMILIRPLIRANCERKRTVHVFIFFIFVVSNCGGLLTPIGDPPLFLGFLRGVPFEWTLGLWRQWLLTVGILMAIFAVMDTIAYGKEKPESRTEDAADYVPTGVAGRVNFLFLAGVIAAVFLPGILREHPGGSSFGVPWREFAMIALLALSLKTGPTGPRRANRFTFGPINEVAILFAGIFLAMIPALEILKARGDELPLDAPWHYFWMTGVLSSFLDNAPTYLVFATTALGDFGIASLAGLARDQALTLAAISCGAVFMGANSYIGNAPNFMVKAICEEAGIKMPSFFGYMLYAVCVLIPIFIFITWIFFV